MNRSRPTPLFGSFCTALISVAVLSCVEASSGPRVLDVPAGMTMADVLATEGAPAFVYETSDGGKILVYEEVTTRHAVRTTDTTPSGATCVGKCGNVVVIKPRQSSETTGTSKTRKKIYTYTIRPDGTVGRITVS